MDLGLDLGEVIHHLGKKLVCLALIIARECEVDARQPLDVLAVEGEQTPGFAVAGVGIVEVAEHGGGE